MDINNDKKEDVLLRDDKHVWLKYARQNFTTLVPSRTYYSKLYVAPTRKDTDQWKSNTDDE